MLRDTLYKQSSLDQEQCWFTWNCLVLVFVFDICNCICLLFCNLLGEFTVIVFESVLEKPCARVNVSVCYQKYIKTYRKFPVERGFVTEPKNII